MKRLALVAVAVGLLIAADKPKNDSGANKGGKDAVKAELKKFQGTWVATSFEENGEKMPAEDVKNIKFTLKGDEWTFQRGDQMLKGTLKMDPTKTPKTFDATVEGSGDTVLGIYEMKDGTWKECWSAPGSDRPKTFTGKADSGQTYVVLKHSGSSGRPSRAARPGHPDNAPKATTDDDSKSDKNKDKSDKDKDK